MQNAEFSAENSAHSIEELHEQINATKLELLETVSSHYTHFSDTFKMAKVSWL